MGHALRRLVCVTGSHACEACLLYHSCPYAYIFETPPPPGSRRMRLYRTAPHPFVLQPAETFLDTHPAQAAPQPWVEQPHVHGRRRWGGRAQAAGEGLYRLGLVLVGRAVRHLPYLVLALARAGEAGIGRDRVPMRLVGVEQEHAPGEGRWEWIGDAVGPLSARAPQPPAPRPLPATVRLRALTPLRIVHGERLVRPEQFRFTHLLRALLRRAGSLHYFHGGGELRLDYRALADASEAVEGEVRMQWREWERYSGRQRALMRMGGVVGDLCLAGSAVAPFWGLLQLGALVHVGKATSMGLGRYELAHGGAR